MTGSNVITLARPKLSFNSDESVTSRNLALNSGNSLKAEAREITALAKQADEHSIEAAKRLVALKQRIERGEAGPKAKWMEWLPLHVKLSPSRLAELIRIGESKHPEAALEDQRRLNRERAKRYRDRNSKSRMSPDRRLLLSLVLRMEDKELSTLLETCRAKYAHLFGR